jgi:hypothetical protein
MHMELGIRRILLGETSSRTFDMEKKEMVGLNLKSMSKSTVTR